MNGSNLFIHCLSVVVTIDHSQEHLENMSTIVTPIVRINYKMIGICTSNITSAELLTVSLPHMLLVVLFLSRYRFVELSR